MTVTDPDVPDPLNDPRTLQADPGALAEGEDLASTGDDDVSAGEDELAANEGLQSAAGRIQAAVGAQTRLKCTPKLHFEPDPVVDRATRIEAALREVRTDDDAHEE